MTNLSGDGYYGAPPALPPPARGLATALRAGAVAADTGVHTVVQQEPLVLIVEDDPESRDGYAEFLERGGFRVAQAASAEDALEQSLTMAPDVIVTDIALPGRDGFELATEIRCEKRTQKIPVVAMTAYWATDVHERADKAGITAILAKPCQPEHLIAELNRVLQRPRLTSRTASPVSPPNGKHRRRPPAATAH